MGSVFGKQGSAAVGLTRDDTYRGAGRACYFALQALECDSSKMQLPPSVTLRGL
jgi:hypothetical protein